MSIFGGFGKLFGFSGDEAEAFGSSLVGEGANTFADNIDKSIDKFDKQVDEYGKITLASDLEDAKVNKKSLNDKINGISKFARLGFSPAYAAAIYSAPVATQKIMVDAANATEDKSTLDSLWKTSLEINKEMPSIGITDAAKLLIGNQVTPERDYSGIPETENMLTRLGLTANLRDAVKNRVESRPDMGVDLSTDVDATIPTGGPSEVALTKAKALNKTESQPRLKTYADETLKLLPMVFRGNKIGASPADVINGLEASIMLNQIQSTQVDTSGNYIGDAMIKSRERQRYRDKLKNPSNPEGIVIFSNKSFINSVKELVNAADGDKDIYAKLEDIISKIREIYGSEATTVFGELIKG